MVGPTGLLCHLRVFRAEHSFLKRCVQPACSQVVRLPAASVLFAGSNPDVLRHFSNGRADPSTLSELRRTGSPYPEKFKWSGRQDLNQFLDFLMLHEDSISST
jgi:hypothetical protein